MIGYENRIIGCIHSFCLMWTTKVYNYCNDDDGQDLEVALLRLASDVDGGESLGGAHGHGLIPLFAQFLARGFQFGLGKVIDGQVLDDAPFSIFNLNREAEHDSFGRAVTAVGEDSHRDELSFGGAVPPGLHVIAGGFGGGHRRAEFPRSDDGGAALLNRRQKCFSEPGFVIDNLKQNVKL